ncbi:hypothetical protein AB751O23_AR_00040 [Chlamydiales bacterium SCGC AB-751-O23]|nr:hypothetical protein AB751O23_AR_00040 [Chlamydiales bacterium SCGC AB-751-O23]
MLSPNDVNSPDSVAKAPKSIQGTSERPINQTQASWEGRTVTAGPVGKSGAPPFLICDAPAVNSGAGLKDGSLLDSSSGEEGSNLDLTECSGSFGESYLRKRSYDSVLHNNVSNPLISLALGRTKAFPMVLKGANPGGLAMLTWNQESESPGALSLGSSSKEERCRDLNFSEKIGEKLSEGYDLDEALGIIFEDMEEAERADVASLDLSSLDLLLSACSLEGAFLKFPNLIDLNLSGNRISDDLLELLAKEGQQLEKLDLSNCEESSEGAISDDPIEGFEVLETIGLKELYIEGLLFLKKGHLTQISRLTTLEVLDLSENKHLIDDAEFEFEDVCSLLEDLTNLTSLMLADWELNEEQKEYISEVLPNLTFKVFVSRALKREGV